MKNFVRRMRKIGNSGSTLIAVMVVTTILSLFLITLQPIMLNYAKGSFDERDLKQADFSARSANDAIVKAILDGNADLIAGINSIPVNGEWLDLDDLTFSSSKMGSIDARIERVSANEFTVITRATKNEAQRTVGRVINKIGSTGGSSHSPLPVFYFHVIDGISINTVGNKPVVIKDTLRNAGKNTMNISSDLYLLNLVGSSLSGQSSLVINGDFYKPTGTFSVTGNAKISYKNLFTLNLNDITSYTDVPTWAIATGAKYRSATNYTTTTNFNSGEYYFMSGSPDTSEFINQLNLSNVTPSSPVYIIVRSGSNITMTSAIDHPVGGVPKDPRVVFILEGTATLNVQHLSSVVVFGAEGSRLNVNNSSGGNPILYGQVRVGNISYNSGSFVTLNYRASTTYNPNPGTVTWTAGDYKKATYE